MKSVHLHRCVYWLLISLLGRTAANNDFWSCARDDPHWHTLRETVRFVMYENGSPLRTSIDRLKGLLTIWFDQKTAAHQPSRVARGAPCPVGEVFLVVLDYVMDGLASMADSRVVDPGNLLWMLQVLQARVPVSAVMRSTWPLFGLLAIAQDKVLGLGTDSLVVQDLKGVATTCALGLRLLGEMKSWMRESALSIPLPSLWRAREEALELARSLQRNPEACGANSEITFAAGKLVLALSHRLRGGFFALGDLFDKTIDSSLADVSWSRLFFTGWPILSFLHRVQEAHFREKDCTEVDELAYSLLSRAQPISVFICVRRRFDVVDERWRTQGVFEDCVSIVTEIQRRQLQDCAFLDVGANFGFCTLGASRLGQRLKVLAFEPEPSVARLLRAAVTRNGVKDSVTVIEAAVGRLAQTNSTSLRCLEGHSATCRTLPLEANPADGDPGRSSIYKNVGEKEATPLKVQSISLDSLLGARVFNQKVCAVKIDVEGAEEDVLRGGVHLFRTMRPPLFLELHPQSIRERGSNAEPVFNLLVDRLGYTSFVPFPNETAGACSTVNNGTYPGARWQAATLVFGLSDLSDPCACAQACSARVLMGCRCWDFSYFSNRCDLWKGCTFSEQIEVKPKGIDDYAWALWAGELSGMWKVEA